MADQVPPPPVGFPGVTLEVWLRLYDEQRRQERQLLIAWIMFAGAMLAGAIGFGIAWALACS